MTDDQADELLSNNDWGKWSDARELLIRAAHMGAMQERGRLLAGYREIAAASDLQMLDGDLARDIAWRMLRA